MIDIDKLSLIYFQNDEPCPYHLKSGITIMIRPIKTKDWSIFELSLNILQIEKNEINDVEIIQMSYLSFLINKVFTESKESQSKLANIFYYSIGENDIRVGKQKNKDCLIICEDDKVKGIITQKEFDEISSIILHQNLKDYSDRYLSPDVKQAIADYYELKYNDTYQPNLEQKKTFVISKTGISMKEINEMSYRIFNGVYNDCIGSELYIGNKIVQGGYQSKKDVIHPLFEKKKDILEEVFSVTDDQFNSKINRVNG